MNLRKNVATSESGFIFNPSTGDSFSANPIAAEILIQLKQGVPPPEIKKTVLTNYEVDSSQLERDWDDFLLQLRDANLLDT
ncbi:MAG: PqqD family protein [Bacteroidota bacterium]